MHEPEFLHRADGTTLIAIGEFGNYRVDLENDRLIEDNRITADYQLRGPTNESELWYGEQKIAEGTSHDRVFFSPAGDVAWLRSSIAHGKPINNINNLELSVFGRDRPQLVVAKGWFCRLWTNFPRPSAVSCLWVMDSQFKKSAALANLDVIQPRRNTTTDTRPNVADLAVVSMKTDRRVYREHEAIEISITVQNKLNEPLTFPTPTVGRWGRPFRLTYKSPRSSGMVSVFDRNWPEPDDGEVSIPPKATRTYTRKLEIFGTGDHSLELWFQHNIWTGRYKLFTDFKVVKSGEEARLLKAKFDRLMARCRQEFEQSANSCHAPRIWDLKAPAAPLLVAYFKAHPEQIPFRQRMGTALAGVADASTLPYLEALLKTDLEHDGNMVVGTCWNMYIRSKYYDKPIQRAIDLLVVAGSHANVEVRRHAIKILRMMTDPAVDLLMQQAAEDADVAIAEMAGRYVAVREQRALDNWLAIASQQMTPARFTAARSIISELEETFGIQRGVFPGGTFDEVIADDEKLKRYQTTVKWWSEWARENDRFSNQFFDKDRAQARRQVGRVTSWMGDKPAAIVQQASMTISLNSSGRGVTLAGQGITDADLDRLKNMSLARLSIQRANITDKGLEKLTRTRRIKALLLGDLDIDGTGLKYLFGINGLEELYLGLPIRGEPLEHLGKLKSLRMLSLSIEPIGSVGLRAIQQMKELRYLRLISVPFTDRQLAALQTLENLEELEFWHSEITNDGLAALSRFPRLKKLSLYGNFRTVDQITDVGAFHLGQLERLETLALTVTSITNEGLSYLANLKQLKRLTLMGNGITGDGLKLLVMLPKLEFLSLDLRVAEAGLEHLKQMKQLSCSYRASDGEDQVFARFQTALPNVGLSFQDP